MLCLILLSFLLYSFCSDSHHLHICITTSYLNPVGLLTERESRISDRDTFTILLTPSNNSSLQKTFPLLYYRKWGSSIILMSYGSGVGVTKYTNDKFPSSCTYSLLRELCFEGINVKRNLGRNLLSTLV